MNKSINKDTILPTLRDIFDTPNKPVAFAGLDVKATPPKKVNASECVRKGKITDLQEVTVLFKKAIQRMNENFIHQWDDIYPDEQTLKNDIDSGFMHLYIIDDKIASVFVLNQVCDPEYTEGDWKYDAASFAVVHRLCVNPDFQNMGIGTRTMNAAESILKDWGFKSVRLDVFSQNPAALRLYEKLGYINVGTVTFRKGLFHLLEKKL